MARMIWAGCVWHATCLMLACADSDRVDRQDEAGLKFPSLMQVRTGRVKTLTSGDSLIGFSQMAQDLGENIGHSDTSGPLVGFIQMVQDLGEKVAGHNYSLGEDENDALEMIRQWIADMNQTITVQHNEDQAEVDRARDSIQQCTDSTVKLLENSVSGYRNTTNADRSAHVACRNEQKTAEGLKIDACADYDEYRKNTLKPSPDCLGTFFDQITSDDPTIVKEAEGCMDKFEAWFVPLQSRHTLCDEKTDKYNNKKQRCNALQDNFERSFCLYELKLSDTCDYHTTCRETHSDVRSFAHTQVRASEQARKAEHITGAKISCLFDVFEADNVNKSGILDRCRDLHVSTSAFDIDYHEAPIGATCSKEPSKPCDEVWNTTEYSGLSVNVDTCTGCQVPTPSPPAPPAPPGSQVMCSSPSLDWKSSRAWCQEKGGDLISIHSAEENQEAVDFGFAQWNESVRESFGGPWIGLVNPDGVAPFGTNPSDYHWSDGTPVDYQAGWKSGELANDTGFRKGGQVLLTYVVGNWTESPVTHPINGICRVPAGRCSE